MGIQNNEGVCCIYRYLRNILEFWTLEVLIHVSWLKQGIWFLSMKLLGKVYSGESTDFSAVINMQSWCTFKTPKWSWRKREVQDIFSEKTCRNLIISTVFRIDSKWDFHQHFKKINLQVSKLYDIFFTSIIKIRVIIAK